MRSSAPDLSSEGQIHGIKLVIEGAQRHELVAEMKPTTQSAMPGAAAPHEMAETVPATKRGHPEEEPGTALLFGDNQQKGRNSAMDETISD